MACDTSIKARKEKKVTINENTTEIIKEKKNEFNNGFKTNARI